MNYEIEISETALKVKNQHLLLPLKAHYKKEICVIGIVKEPAQTT